MPNFLDLPAELRLMIYTAHFSVIKEESTASLQTSPLFLSSRAVAVEALKVAETILARENRWTKYQLEDFRTQRVDIQAELNKGLRTYDWATACKISRKLQEVQDQIIALGKKLVEQHHVDAGLRSLWKCLEKLT